ncbi:hypothetical protein K1T35_48585 (plasmid) [Pseudonocardia sp. DSM 110487]|uniref:hypothetical protein n=1 Tax=Pseudonocardia sp. DSM 110487 TaxID=2865833 RepID=UPI001C69E4B3|nr:hypothetical protein [Pseudonocardia sp. DSM 110487]QYN41206.1 hypothetical protein K1T35_48585 [Pseudonocardia sp. DSM 110487]
MMVTDKATPDPPDLKPGDRVRCYDTFDATVIRVESTWLDSWAVVEFDRYLDYGPTPVPVRNVLPL